VDGVYEEPVAPGSASEVSVALGTWHALGDLDGDGVADAAAVLIESGGGSGSFFDLAVVVARPLGPVHAAGAFLGDRVGIESVSIEAATVVVRMKAHRPGDPLCCPSAETALRFRLDGSTLLRVGASTGPL